MCQWCPPSASLDIDSVGSVWGRTRGEQRLNSPTASNLVVLPILLLFLGVPSHHREGYLWLCAAGTMTEYLHHNTTRGTDSEGYVWPPNATTHPRQRIFQPNLTKQESKVPSRNSKEATLCADYGALTDSNRKVNAQKLNGLGYIRKIAPRTLRRKRRAAEDSPLQSSPVSGWTLLPTPSPSELGEIPPTLSRSTTVPDVRITTSVHLNSESTHAISSSPSQPTPTPSFHTTEDQRPGGYSSRPFLNPSPLHEGLEQVNTVMVQPTPTPMRPQPRTTDLAPIPPSLGTVAPTNRIVSAPPPLSLPGDPASSAPLDSKSLEPSEFPLTSDASYSRAQTDTVGFAGTPGDHGAETRSVSTTSRFPSTATFVNHSAIVTPAKSSKTSPSPLPAGPSNDANAGGARAKQGSKVYTIISEIETEPSILIIMPCLVGLALLGLVAAGVKRWVLYRRIGRVVELVRDPERLEQDKGYTIENPMVKNRRSYIERQMERTLQKVNKTESNGSSSNGASKSCSSNTNGNASTKVRMEIATISGGSLRRPARPLRRSASERVAPSRRSRLGYSASQRTECRCYCACHCPVCGLEGSPLENGRVETGTTTTKL